MNVIEYAKLSGSGNDFLCIDNRDGRFGPLLADPRRVGHFAHTILRRGLAIGADGVLFACENEAPSLADFTARHFEPDGSEAELCGNGVACFTRWVIENGWAASDEVKVLADAGIVRGKRLEGGYVRVCIPLPEQIRRDFEIEAAGVRWRCDFCVTGVPHVVTYVNDVEALDLEQVGPALRHHGEFRPRGVNANFVQVLSEGRLAVRTWEFGVEGETLSCGTGSSASAILAALRFGWPEKYLRGDAPVHVRARSGDTLRVYFTLAEDLNVTDLCIETVVRFVCTGQIHPDLASKALGSSFPQG